MREQKAEAQQILDDLFSEKLLPFKLSARQVESIGGEEYIVRFHDIRLPSIDVSWGVDQSFKDVFRTAVLERVARLSGSFHQNPSI